MNYLGKFISNFRHVYNEINPATLTGAIDIVVVEQPDGTFTCSPFHVRFGKIGVLRSREKIVSKTSFININRYTNVQCLYIVKQFKRVVPKFFMFLK